MPPGGPPKRNWLPWALGCGGCGLLIVVALVFFGAIARYGAQQAARSAGKPGDTTVVVGDTAGDVSAKPTGDGTSTETTETTEPTDGSSTEPTDAGTPESDGKPELKEIRPVSEDSTF